MNLKESAECHCVCVSLSIPLSFDFVLGNHAVRGEGLPKTFKCSCKNGDEFSSHYFAIKWAKSTRAALSVHGNGCIADSSAWVVLVSSMCECV